MTAERKLGIKERIMAKIKMLIAFDKESTKQKRRENIKKVTE